MKKIIITLLTLGIAALVSCSKISNEIRLEPAPAPETFTVNVPGSYETKTTLVGLKPTWVTGDEIRVYGHNTDADTYTDNAVYELKSGNGEGTAVFSLKSGEIGLSGTYDEFYAVYPATLTVTGLPSEMTLPRLNSSPSHMRGQNPSAGQIDPNLAVMTAKYNGSTMSFRHGVSYIKLTIPDDGVTKVDINFTANCLGDTPTYDAATGALKSVANSAKNITSISGTFVQGESYYFAAIPRAGYAPTTTVITLTGGGTYTTTHFTKLPEVGKVYDLGCPAKVPLITAADVNIAQDATGGNIAFSIVNPAGDGVISIAPTAGKTNPVDFVLNTTLQTDHFEFTCGKNAAADARKFYVTITYSYNGGVDETSQDVVITQAGTVSAVHKDWNFSSSDWQTALTAQAPDAKASNKTSWSVVYDDLTYNSGSSSSKWDTEYIQPGGAGDTSKRYFTFTATTAGTLTVYVKNPTSSENESSTRVVKVKVGSGSEQTSASVLYGALEERAFTIAAGEVKIYPGNNGLRFYRIKFDSE